MKHFINGQVGAGRARHAVFTIGPMRGETACGKIANDLARDESTVTCKSCLKALPSWIGYGDALISEAHDEALAEQARREAEQAPRELDIWLTEGVVLVDPDTGERLIFEGWAGGMAAMRNQRTGARVLAAQSHVTTWKYVPRQVECDQVWRDRETGAPVHVVDRTASSALLLGRKPADRPFWVPTGEVPRRYVRAVEQGA